MSEPKRPQPLKIPPIRTPHVLETPPSLSTLSSPERVALSLLLTGDGGERRRRH